MKEVFEMAKETLEMYEDCVKKIRELIHAWEQMRPEEELVVMVLPKYDKKARKEQLEGISKMLLNEKW